MTTSDRLSVLALVISLVGVGWQILWSIYGHRKEVRRAKERIKTAIAFWPADSNAKYFCPDAPGPEPQVRVNLYNLSDFSLNIQSVALVVKSGPADVRKWKLLSPHWSKMPLAGREVSDPVLMGYRDFIELPPRTSDFFELPGLTDDLRKGVMDACQSRRGNVWIAVSTHAGEIARLPGHKVIPVLKKYAHASNATVAKPLHDGPTIEFW